MMSRLLVEGLPACPVLHSDEGVDDWLAVTASLYSSDSEALLELVARLLDWPWQPQGGLERPGDLKRALETELRSVYAASASLASLPGLLAPQAYCPLCFDADLRRGELPYFRSAWARALATMCARHRTPLFHWSSGWPRNPKGLLEWIVANYRKGRSLKRRVDRPKEVDKYRVRLQRSREAQRWAQDGVEQYYVLEQQLIWETGLADPRSYTLIQGVAGGDPKAFRRAFDDLCVVYLAQFTADWRESHPVMNYSYMGPSWLFALPERQPFADIDLNAPLRRTPVPAQRRSVIAMVMRSLVGFSADVVCDARGMITDAGGTMLTADLNKLSTAAKEFLARRSSRWPPFVRAGVRRALS